MGRVAMLGVGLLVLGVGDVIIKESAGIDGPNLWRLFTGLVGGIGVALLAVWFVYTVASKAQQSRQA